MPEPEALPVFDPDLEQPQLGGCWLRQPDGTLIRDPAEPVPSSGMDEPQPE
jgi:hypothetical protein